MPTVNVLVNIVKVELANLLPKGLFLVRDLFKEHDWNWISQRERSLVGTLFLNFNANIGVIVIEKTSSESRNIQNYNFVRRLLLC